MTDIQADEHTEDLTGFEDQIDDVDDTEELEYDDRSIDVVDAGGSASSGSRRRRQITRQGASKAIGKFVELSAAPREHLAILATAMGGKPDPAELAATIVSSPRVNLTSVNDLLAVADAAAESPYAGMLKSMELAREQLRNVWSLMQAADLVSGSFPSKESAGAIAVAEAAAKVSAPERDLLDAVRALARK